MEAGSASTHQPDPAEGRSEILGAHMYPDYGDEPLIPSHAISLADLPGVLDKLFDDKDKPVETTNVNLLVKLRGERD